MPKIDTESERERMNRIFDEIAGKMPEDPRKTQKEIVSRSATRRRTTPNAGSCSRTHASESGMVAPNGVRNLVRTIS